MIPAAFDYELAGNIDEAISLLGQSGEAKLIAGGHSLLPLMRLRFAQPDLLVDIGRIDDLSYVRDAGDSIAVGAMTRHADVAADPLLGADCGILAETAAQIGDPQVRHRGTLGGSIAHADPASDLPTVLLALDAEFDVRGPAGDRTIAAGDFFTGFLESALEPTDVLTEVRVPKLDGPATYAKYNRRAQDWATVAVAAVQRNGGTALALTNMAATPVRALGVEQALADGADAATAAARVGEGTNPPSDTNGSAEYRAHLATVLTRRALEQLSA